MKTPTLSLFLLLSVCVAHGQSLKSEIAKYNRAISEAMIKKDMTKVGQMFRKSATPDFRYVEDGRSMTIDQMVQNMNMGLSFLKKVTVANARLISLKEKGKTATGVAEYKMGGIMIGPDKKSHVMMSSGISTDTYVKTSTGWKVKKMVWGHNKMTVDGKPMNPDQMMPGK